MLKTEPSPNVQFHDVGVPPVEVSLNRTVSGVVPDVAFGVKVATGAMTRSLTVITVPELVLSPALLETDKVAVNVPVLL